ncbi:large subunit ribosomal protein L15 [Mycoplasmoides fastidiosum]|uniref:Large ribosomal subunit protein uL15 n=1 Tax=Mycoplasmoides fastidiosum TaxID=92758 RepID=A0ABU0LY27_9BACT|nr:50S ribosomal protein L15 [Mycoplasmoides fastidiosum]MDQ0513616.1 large subunit ribosomal protein L15 [Mycoplasmoides fastidiosum]UUD37961.1 50S ribosomal protein L15 [Mycoplasmoides fastidiosum]
MLNQLKSHPKARNHRSKRVGRGFGSGIGGRSTRGTKGQLARKSGNVRLGFEGGQTPLYIRVGKIGFNNHNFATAVSVINLFQLSFFPEETEFDLQKLIELRLVHPRKTQRIKVIGNHQLTRPINISAHAFSKGAEAVIKAAGGKIHLLKP